MKRIQVEILLQVQNRVPGLTAEDGRWHAIHQVTCNKKRITPEAKKDIIVKEKGTSYFN